MVITCWPVQDWLATSGIASGPVIRPVLKGSRLGEVALTAHAVAALTKKKGKDGRDRSST